MHHVFVVSWTIIYKKVNLCGMENNALQHGEQD